MQIRRGPATVKGCNPKEGFLPESQETCLYAYLLGSFAERIGRIDCLWQIKFNAISPFGT
ncbi:hypothetical protein BCE02nite_43380 [Brevibacillus centrosporus]|nr:hypothetical protein BCE02nite_43380 [Brevibacillus centrosporus]